MKIDENTKTTLGFMGVLMGGVIWLTSIHLQSVSNAQEIREVRDDVKQIQEIKMDLSVIKSDLKRVLKRVEGGE